MKKTPEQNRETLLEQLIQIKQAHGMSRLPTNQELIDLGHKILTGRVNRVGGIASLRLAAGEPLLREKGKYYDSEKTIALARKIQADHKLAYLTTSQLRKLGYGQLATAITRHHGGFVKFRQNLVTPTSTDFEKSNQTRPTRYWNKWDHVGYELKLISMHLGHFPSPTDIKNLDLPKTLSQAIANHGGVYEVSRRIGYPVDRKPDGYWLDIENVKREAKEFLAVHKMESLPSGFKLFKLGYSALAGAIQTHHGGFIAFRKLLGDESDGYLYWQDRKKTDDYAKALLKKHSWTTLPASQTLERLGYNGFVAGVRRYHGGLESFREDLGLKNLQTARGLWRDRIYVETKLKEAMDELGLNEMPSAPYLHKNGYSPLAAAIGRYHGGFPAFRKSLPDQKKDDLEKLLGDYAA